MHSLPRWVVVIAAAVASLLVLKLMVVRSRVLVCLGVTAVSVAIVAYPYATGSKSCWGCCVLS